MKESAYPAPNEATAAYIAQAPAKRREKPVSQWDSGQVSGKRDIPVPVPMSSTFCPFS